MIRSKESQWLGIALFVVLLLWLVAGSLEGTGRTIVGLLLALLAAGLWRSRSIRFEEENKSLLKSKRREYELQLIRTLNHHRHDWMNDIQVLFGYIKMKKYDNLQGYVERIKTKIQQESGISKLGEPALVAYLLSFRTQTNEVQLEVELEQEVRLDELPLDKEQASSVVIGLLEKFRRHVIPSMDGSNTLSVELAVEEDHLLIDCVYRGAYARQELQHALEQTALRSAPDVRVIHADFNEEEAAVAVAFPFIHN